MTGIDGPQNRFDCSKLMQDIDHSHQSPQGIESQRWNHALENSQRALHQSTNLPAYRQLRKNTTPVWNQGLQKLQSSFQGTMEGGGGGSAVQSPSSDTTVKLGDDYKGRTDGYAQPPVHDIPVNAPETYETQATRNSKFEDLLSPRSRCSAVIMANSPRQPHFGGPNHTFPNQTMGALTPGWNPPAQMQTETLREPFRFAQNSNHATFSDAALRSSSLPSPPGSPKNLHMPHRTKLHERLSERISSLPSIPSPLGPRSMREHLHGGEDGGVLLSSVPNGRFQGRKLQHRESRTPLPHSPTVQRYASTGAISPTFDVYPRSAHIDDEGNIFINSSGHSRKHTDPFVDHEPVQYGSRSARPLMTGLSTHFQLLSQPSMHPPPTPVSAAWPTSALPTFGFVLQPTLALTPLASVTFGGIAGQPAPVYAPAISRSVSRGRPPARSNLFILPLPLPSIHGKYRHTQEARARLETQKLVREEWIRTEAVKIAQLARLRQTAYLRYGETRAEQDFKKWQQIEAALADATNLEKRQEERRNLFLNEKGMTALKTDNARDMSAANRGKAGGSGEEKLLGYNMALMERECAEAKCDEDDATITAEMLRTLSLDEKRALRKHLLERLEKS